MMKQVFLFFLCLGFLLLRGYDHLYARTAHHLSTYSPAQLPAAYKNTFSNAGKNNQSLHSAATNSAADDCLTATEMEDDDDFESSRKWIEISHYFLNVLHTQMAGDVHRHLKDRLPFCKHFSFTASEKHIVQRVIRV